MATVDELKSQITAAKAEFDNALRASDILKAEQVSAQGIYKEAQGAPEGLNSYIFNGQVFTNKEDYVKATYNNFTVKKSEADEGIDLATAKRYKLRSLQADLSAAEDPTSTVKTPSSTNDGQSDLDIQDQYETSTAENAVDSGDAIDNPWSSTPEDFEPSYGERSVPGVSEGAERPVEAETKVNVKPLRAVNEEDLRVKIRVPKNYLTGIIKGSGLENLSGIIFPYTPTLNFDMKADYTTVSPLHSNFPINFYKSSSITAINIAGNFTVENDKDASFYIATVHLLRALTRMLFGSDSLRGAPPPVCRLDAYGDLMLKNVPVVINNFRVELPNTVDYYTFKYKNKNLVSIPTLSSINVTCTPTYSRNEMQAFSVSDYLKGSFVGRGII